MVTGTPRNSACQKGTAEKIAPPTASRSPPTPRPSSRTHPSLSARGACPERTNETHADPTAASRASRLYRRREIAIGFHESCLGTA